MIPKTAGDHFKLSTDATALYQQSPETFLSTYGNAFINQLSAGDSLYIMLQIHFESQQAKQSFEEQISAGKADIAQVMLKLQSAIEYNHLKGSINIHALQLGGDPSQLSKVFEKSTGEGYAFAAFNFSNINQGLAIIKNAISYSQGALSAGRVFRGRHGLHIRAEWRSSAKREASGTSDMKPWCRRVI